MKVFITWSGTKSKVVASALQRWIPDVLNNVETWMSEVSIKAGVRWGSAVANELASSQCGIICLTRSNVNEPWILFETGALAKTLRETYVCPYLIDLDPSDVPSGPLSQFQGKRANREETLQLMQTLNEALNETRLAEDRLLRSFDRCWSDLDKVIQSAQQLENSKPIRRPIEEMVEEILELARKGSAEVRFQGEQHQEYQDKSSKQPAEDEEPGIPVRVRNPMWG